MKKTLLTLTLTALTAMTATGLPLKTATTDTDETETTQTGRMVSQKMPCRLLPGITERDYSIYLPGSYDQQPGRKYPVLYLMHGGGGSHTDWERHYQLSAQADKLMGSGIINDMVIVCAEGNQQNMMYFNAPQWKYEDYFFQELIPYIEKTYRVRTDKGGRAIAGFSMGGGAATVYGVHHPDMFGMVYDISGYLRAQSLDFLKNDPSAEWRQKVIEENNPIVRLANGTEAEVADWKRVDWVVSVGDHDFTLEANMDLVKTFRQKGIPYTMHVAEGIHDARWVTPALGDALKRADSLFRKNF